MNERAMNAGWQDVSGRVRIAWRQLNNICILKTRQSDKERKKAASIRNDDDEARKKMIVPRANHVRLVITITIYE